MSIDGTIIGNIGIDTNIYGAEVGVRSTRESRFTENNDVIAVISVSY